MKYTIKKLNNTNWLYCDGELIATLIDYSKFFSNRPERQQVAICYQVGKFRDLDISEKCIGYRKTIKGAKNLAIKLHESKQIKTIVWEGA